MPSLVPGYEYDIFISYRQKDNKGERWVSEFVNALRAELEATFKDDISIYFDENTHDGLLDTHQVEQSLENKLRSLLIIPVLSRTYCDPRSYAWTNEFLPFIQKTQADELGPMVRLPNGNVSSRVLPVRIHELESSDQSLFEEASGNRIRAVDFVFKSTGVNRPMNGHEDHPHDNLNKTYYRDQVNKVANSVSEVIQAILAGQMEGASQRSEKKGADGSKIIMVEEAAPKEPGYRARRLIRWGVIGVIGLTAIGFAGWFINREAKIRWAENTALPAVAAAVDEASLVNMWKSYQLAIVAEEYIPDNPELASLLMKCSVHINVETEPPGARVYYKNYDAPEAEWLYLGTTPIDSIRVPVATLRWKFEKEGYQPVMAAATTWGIDFSGKSLVKPLHLSRRLDKEGSIPSGMVRATDLRAVPILDDFFIDQFEVTNSRYKRFMNEGGYQDKKYWKHEFREDGKHLTFEEAMPRFVDQTGRPGPAGWEAGDFPEGQGDYPVSGVSWYEAAAFAEFEGKSLPTAMHWNVARGIGIPLNQTNFEAVVSVLHSSNFSGKEVAPVGSSAGITAFGASDMAGNCREWCLNPFGNERIARGGSWMDPIYTYGRLQPAPPMSRLANFGFRCALYTDPNRIPEKALEQFTPDKVPDFYSLKPVSQEIFNVYKEQFAYDKVDREARTTPWPTTSPLWKAEQITIPAAYGDEKLNALLFLPTNATPPYQTVIYFPGSGAVLLKSREGIDQGDEFNTFISFLLKSGRAVLWPSYKGTFERNNNAWSYHIGDSTLVFSEYLRQIVKDFKVSVDYLETRPDVDRQKFAYMGMSWGAWMGPFVLSTDNRLQAAVLIAGGLKGGERPEANEINYITRVKLPTLMLNGKFDLGIPLETSVQPTYDLLGTPPEHKRLMVYESSHIPPKKEVIAETLAWLEKYLGPVAHK